MPDPGVLDSLAMEADELEQKIRLEAEGNPVVQHAANMVAMASTGIRKAIRQLEEKTDRAERRAVNQAAHAVAHERWIEDVAKRFGRTYDEQIELMRKAQDRVAGRPEGVESLVQSRATAPVVNPVDERNGS